MAGAYGEEFARAMTFFTDMYGIPPQDESDGGGDRGGRAQRLLGARAGFSVAQGHRQGQ